MKDQPWDLNQTWPVDRKWCRFTNAPQTFCGLFFKFGVQKTSNFYHFLATFALDTAYLLNEMSHGQTKMLVSLYNVSPKR